MKSSFATRKSYSCIKVTGTPKYSSPYRTQADPVLGSIFILVVIAVVMAVMAHPEWFTGI
jgi:hypothetical protein